jgi:hypothetical protein
MSLLGASHDDDVDDPVGMARAAVRNTAEELRILTDRLITALWPQQHSAASVREAPSSSV